MKYLCIFLSLLSAGTAFSQTNNLKDEALQAIGYLNRVRQNPEKYSDSCGVKLAYVKAKPALKINSILMKVAEVKAADMATRNYFSHTNPEGEGINILIHKAGYTLSADSYKNKSSNFFESISAGYGTGIKNINNLILDEGLNPPGHRNHLLGIDSFWADCTDIGIGIAYNPKSEYHYYLCVIIARQ